MSMFGCFWVCMIYRHTSCLLCGYYMSMFGWFRICISMNNNLLFSS